MPGWYFAHVHNDVIPHILHMRKGTFLLYTAHIYSKYSDTITPYHTSSKVFTSPVFKRNFYLWSSWSSQKN